MLALVFGSSRKPSHLGEGPGVSYLPRKSASLSRLSWTVAIMPWSKPCRLAFLQRPSGLLPYRSPVPTRKKSPAPAANPGTERTLECSRFADGPQRLGGNQDRGPQKDPVLGEELPLQ